MFYLPSLRVEYAQVTKMLGGGRVSLQCYDGVTRMGLIRGTMRRRVWINTVSPPTVSQRRFLMPIIRHETHYFPFCSFVGP
jgi:initiation factor 1A